MGYKKVRDRPCGSCDGYGVPTDVNLAYCSCLYGMVEHLRFLLAVKPKKRNNTLIFKIRENIKKMALSEADQISRIE